MLSLTATSHARALRLLTDLKGKKVSKVTSKGLADLKAAAPEAFGNLCVINRSMFGTEQGLGPDDEGFMSSLRGKVMLRVNGDRDIVQVQL